MVDGNGNHMLSGNIMFLENDRLPENENLMFPWPMHYVSIETTSHIGTQNPMYRSYKTSYKTSCETCA